MSAWDETREVERRGMAILMPKILREAKSGVYVIPKAQQHQGDVVIDGQRYEFKIEEKYTGNLFIEQYSNRRRQTLGWLHFCESDWIWFFFLQGEHLIECCWPVLQRLVKERARFYRLAPMKNRAHLQLNDSWGYLVPISWVLQNVVTAKRLSL